MGLDGVELVLAFEEEFGVPIPDEAAESLKTPRDVINFVCAARYSANRGTCLSRRAFHVLRRKLIGTGHLRKSVRPAAALEEFFPPDRRTRLWPELRGELTATQWPDLVRPTWLVRSLAVLVLGASISTALSIAQSSEWGIALLAGTGALIFLIPLLESLTRSFCTRFPEMNSIGDLALRIASAGTSGLLHAWEEPDRASVAAIVRQLTIDQVGLSPDQYSEDKEFVRDLGID